jgi:predicted protein tyrosine phosphatase
MHPTDVEERIKQQARTGSPEPHLLALVEQMLHQRDRLAAAKLPQDKTTLQRQIEATDQQIHRLVYELYGLTEEEVAIVEGRGG